jgi:hypothetical protein
VCVAALLLYLANRWYIKPSALGHIGFFHSYFNDVLCIPLFLPPVLWIHRKLGLRMHDAPPTAFEVLFHLVVWSICFEAVAPRLPQILRTTADPLDVAAYAVGAGVAGLVWRWRRERTEVAGGSTCPGVPGQNDPPYGARAHV